MRLAGKVAVVTGAQQGIGAAICEAFGREGARVAVNWLDDAQAGERVAAACGGVRRRFNDLRFKQYLDPPGCWQRSDRGAWKSRNKSLRSCESSR